MLGSIFGSRSSHATKRSRARSTSQVSTTTRRADKAERGDDEAGDAVEKKPDVEELRKRRQSYDSLSTAQRRQVAASVSATPKGKSSRPSSTRSSVSKDGVRSKRKHTSSRRPTPRTNRSTVNKGGDVERVYGPAADAVDDDGVAMDNVEGKIGGKKAGEKRERSIRSGPTSHSSSKRRSLPTVMETEVTPDDSISQVAERRENENQIRHSRRAHVRPSMKRSSTASTRLQSVAEDPADLSPATSTWKRSSKRESSIAAPTRRHSTTSIPSSTKLVECLTCGSDDIPQPKSAELSCGHRMCHDCLKRIFEMSVKDPAHMPPKCCNEDHIPLKHVDKLFDLKFKILWNRKYQEYHTKNRVYCPTPKCGEWIKPKHIHKGSEGRRYALCPRCKTKVCTLCNNKMHKSTDCPKDPEIAKLVEQAKEKGWQRCYSCHAMIELQSGCNHITCRCKAEFCVCCGAQWKTCNCPWFNYSQIPNPDRLNDMRVPEPIRVIYRRVLDAAGGIPPPPLPVREHARQGPAVAPPEVTYQQELDNRREQERADADLARRLQLASLWEDDDPNRPQQRRRRPDDNTWGVGNGAGHFLNEDFVRNAANVVMDAFGDANFGRRGERAAGRRRRARPSASGSGQNEGEGGLAPNWLGDESVLGVGPVGGVSGRR